MGYVKITDYRRLRVETSLKRGHLPLSRTRAAMEVRKEKKHYGYGNYQTAVNPIRKTTAMDSYEDYLLTD